MRGSDLYLNLLGVGYSKVLYCCCGGLSWEEGAGGGMSYLLTPTRIFFVVIQVRQFMSLSRRSYRRCVTRMVYHGHGHDVFFVASATGVGKKESKRLYICSEDVV